MKKIEKASAIWKAQCMKSNSLILKLASDAINSVIYTLNDAWAKEHSFDKIMISWASILVCDLLGLPQTED